MMARAAAGFALAIAGVAACSSFSEQQTTPPDPDAGASPEAGLPDASAGDADLDGAACGAALGALVDYETAPGGVTAIVADARTLWYTTATAVYRKEEGKTAVLVGTGADVGPIALTDGHAVWLATSTPPQRGLFSVPRTGGAAFQFREYAGRTLATTSDTVFYGANVGVARSLVLSTLPGTTDEAIITRSAQGSTAPSALAVGGSTIAFIGPPMDGAGPAVLVGKTSDMNRPPTATLDPTPTTANAITVAPDGSRVFWTRTSGEVMARHADMSDVARAVVTGLMSPRAIVADASSLYILTDQALVRTRTDGACRSDVPQPLPLRVALGGEYVYVASSSKILRTKK